MIEIEQEGLELLLSALRHPVCDGNRLACQLFLGFNREWIARQAGETDPGNLEPLNHEDVNDTELKVMIGLMYGIANCPNVKPYLMTVAVATAILFVCNEELERRQAENVSIQYH
jgi:hypothetical protein